MTREKEESKVSERVLIEAEETQAEKSLFTRDDLQRGEELESALYIQTLPQASLQKDTEARHTELRVHVDTEGGLPD